MRMATRGRGSRPTFLGHLLAVVLAMTPVMEASASSPESDKTDTSPTVTVRGKVVEHGSGHPVPATVHAAGQTVTTADDGSFSMALPPGDHEIIIQSAEDEHRTLTVTQQASDAEELVFRVERRSWDEELVVYGHDEGPEVSRTVISAEELGDVPASLGDPLRALQSLPSVARPAHLEGALVVRGAEAINTAAYIDEVPVPYLYHFLIGRSVVNPALLDEIAFYPGGMSSRYGNAAQAIVDARTIGEPPEHGVHGRVTVDPLDFGASAEATVGDWSLQAGGRMAWVGSLISAGATVYAQTQGENERPGYSTIGYHDYMLRGAYQRGAHRITLTAFGAHDHLRWHEPTYPSDNPDGQQEEEEVDDLPYDPNLEMDSGFHRVHARWDVAVDGRRHSTWIAAGPEETTSLLEGIGRLTDGGLEYARMSGWTGAARHDTTLPVTEQASVSLGGSTQVQTVQLEDYLDITDGVAATTEDLVLSSGAWIEWEQRVGGLAVAPGVRGSLHQFNDQSHLVPEPRLSARQKLTERWDLTGFVGRFSQTPPTDRYAKGIGNPDIGLITSWQVSAGLQGHWPSGLETELTGYSSWMDGLVVPVDGSRAEPRPHLSDPTADDLDTAYHTYRNTVEFQDVVGRAYGGELLVRLRPYNGWHGWASASVGRAERIREDGTVYVANHDLPYAFSVFAAKRLPRDWQIAAKGQLTAGYPYTPSHGAFVAAESYWIGVEEEINSARFPPFRQVDLRVEKTWTGRRARWTGSLDLHNVTNAQNPILADYTPNYQELQTLAYIPFFPLVGLEVEY